MNKHILSVLKFIGFLSVGVIILFAYYYTLDKSFQEDCITKGIAKEDCSLLKKLWADALTTNKWLLFMAVLAFIVSNVARALRWQQLISSLGYKSKFASAFWAIMLGYGANLVLPRAGEVARAGSFSATENVPFVKTMGTIVLGRLIDVLCLLLLIGLAVIFAGDVILDFLSENTDAASMQGKLYFLGALAVAGLVGLFVFFKLRETLSKFPLFEKIYSIVDGFGDGIKSIFKLKNPLLFVGYTIMIWGMYLSMYFLMFKAFEPTAHLGWVTVLVTFVFGSFGIVIPSPGGMGTYHFLVVKALEIYGVNSIDAFSYANISFFNINLFGNILFGLIAPLFLISSSKKVETE